MKISKVGEGAYFVPSYSEQTVLSYDSLMTNQTVLPGISEEDEGKMSSAEKEHDFTKRDFEQALRKVSRKVKK